jgi:hypothetical protein
VVRAACGLDRASTALHRSPAPRRPGIAMAAAISAAVRCAVAAPFERRIEAEQLLRDWR